ncbi:MAG: hypothetical protein JRF36_11680 [Deltaproteobacteria bacterium]|jgi:hypothetical protein|nr:hypothetical protein [Deltaproteobacteria bacterium]MBW2489327.1 hypothetical protein [Deltaproteobacteria bacterium]MBW2518008.1 hypothetical protein [Deltaproteobacteria bacterium]
MKKTLITISCTAVLVFIITHPLSGLNSESIVRLKQAGVSDKTIQLMAREKVVETAAFSVQEIIDMKKAGLSEKTIQMVIREGSFLKDTAPIIYGKDVRSIEFTTAADIIALKNAGVSNDVIQAIITVVGDSTDAERRDAYRLLENMEIRVDLRDGD